MYRLTDFSWKRLTLGSCSRSKYVTMMLICRQIGFLTELKCVILTFLSRMCSTVSAGLPRRKTMENWKDRSMSRSVMLQNLSVCICRHGDGQVASFDKKNGNYPVVYLNILSYGLLTVIKHGLTLNNRPNNIIIIPRQCL